MLDNILQLFLFYSILFYSIICFLLLNVPYNKIFKKLYHTILELKKDPNVFIEKQLQKITVEEWIHYISLSIFIFGLCILHFCIVPSGDDTSFFNHALAKTSYIDYLTKRYNFVTSRLLIESVLINCYGLNFGIWRFLDVLVWVLIAECIVSICFTNKKYAVFVYSILIFFIDHRSLCSAGWGATTVNYAWTLAASMPSFVIIKKIFERKSLSKIGIAISILLMIFAVNHEQVVALVLGFNISFLIFRIIQNRKFSKEDLYFILIILICIVSLLFILTCPGTACRYEKEVKTWFPEYPMLSFLDKVQIGLLTILTYYFSFKRGMFTIISLCVILSLIFLKNNKKLFILQIILNLFLFFCFLGKKIDRKHFWLLNNKLPQFSEYSQLIVLIECLILLIVALILLYQVYAVMKNKLQGLLNIFLVGAGFCSAFILAFSPTVYVSYSRCYLFMSTIIFIVTFRIFNDYLIQKSSLQNTPSIE